MYIEPVPHIFSGLPFYLPNHLFLPIQNWIYQKMDPLMSLDKGVPSARTFYSLSIQLLHFDNKNHQTNY